MTVSRQRNPNLTGSTLKAWRKQRGWSQHKLGMRLGTSQELISAWEREARGLPFYLGLALNWLAQEDDKARNPRENF